MNRILIIRILIFGSTVFFGVQAQAQNVEELQRAIDDAQEQLKAQQKQLDVQVKSLEHLQQQMQLLVEHGSGTRTAKETEQVGGTAAQTPLSLGASVHRLTFRGQVRCEKD
jgi:uncharacterized protein HemX